VHDVNAAEEMARESRHDRQAQQCDAEQHARTLARSDHPHLAARARHEISGLRLSRVHEVHDVNAAEEMARESRHDRQAQQCDAEQHARTLARSDHPHLIADESSGRAVILTCTPVVSGAFSQELEAHALDCVKTSEHEAASKLVRGTEAVRSQQYLVL
jgi:hypothetical protein